MASVSMMEKGVTKETYGFQQMQKVPPRFVGDRLGIDGLDGRLGGHHMLWTYEVGWRRPGRDWWRRGNAAQLQCSCLGAHVEGLNCAYSTASRLFVSQMKHSPSVTCLAPKCLHAALLFQQSFASLATLYKTRFFDTHHSKHASEKLSNSKTLYGRGGRHG